MADKDATTTQPAVKKIRILSDININGKPIKPNTVVTVPADVADNLVAQGIADDSDAAIEYALTVNPDVVNPFANAAE